MGSLRRFGGHPAGKGADRDHTLALSIGWDTENNAIRVNDVFQDIAPLPFRWRRSSSQALIFLYSWDGDVTKDEGSKIYARTGPTFTTPAHTRTC